jgi:O-antigen/teichoic acid export membrane protein
LLSADVLLVKHFFPVRAAGEYAAVAAVGRAIFWGATGVAAVLFPKVVFRTTQGRSGSPLVVASLLLVAIGGFVALALLSATSRWLLTAFAGGAYKGGATYLAWYALGMTMLGGVAVLVATHQSRGRPGFLAILLPLTLLEPVLLMTMHESLIQVVQVVDFSMGVILVGMGVAYFLGDRISTGAAAEASLGEAHEHRIARSVVNQ